MSEWGRGGGQVPRNEAAQREHLKEVQEDLQRDRQADRVAKAHHKRPWWQFWRSRHEPPPDHKSGPDAGGWQSDTPAASTSTTPWPRHDWHRRVIGTARRPNRAASLTPCTFP
jgi:hypothetical protein